MGTVGHRVHITAADSSASDRDVSTPWFEVPPDGYGGIEAICHTLAEGLIQRGHEVTSIGAGTDHDLAGFSPTFTEPRTVWAPARASR